MGVAAVVMGTAVNAVVMEATSTHYMVQEGASEVFGSLLLSLVSNDR